MIFTSLKLVNFVSPQLIDTKRLFSTFSTSASLVIGNIWSRRIAFRNQFFSKSQRPIDSKHTPKTNFDHNQYKIRCQTQNCCYKKMTQHIFVATDSRRILAHFEKMSLVHWFWAFFEKKNVLARKMRKNERIFVCLSSSIGMMKANKIPESFPTYRVLSFEAW